MIIDVIQDRQHGTNWSIGEDGMGRISKKYNAKAFYNEMMMYQDTGGGEIADAMDCGTEQDVKRALYLYIVEQEYNIDFCKYIKSVKWL